MSTVYKGCAFYIIDSYYRKLCPCQNCPVKIVCYEGICNEFLVFKWANNTEERVFRAENKDYNYQNT